MGLDPTPERQFHAKQPSIRRGGRSSAWPVCENHRPELDGGKIGRVVPKHIGGKNETFDMKGYEKAIRGSIVQDSSGLVRASLAQRRKKT